MIKEELLPTIFGLYIGCELIAPDPSEEQITRKGYLTGIHGEYQAEIQFIDDNNNVWEEPSYSGYNKVSLLVKPTSGISDEDLIKCYHLHSSAIGYDYTQDFKDILTCAKHWLENGGKRDLLKYSICVDYLRANGYAVPYEYYSVDQLTEAGIFKLKTP